MRLLQVLVAVSPLCCGSSRDSSVLADSCTLCHIFHKLFSPDNQYFTIENTRKASHNDIIYLLVCRILRVGSRHHGWWVRGIWNMKKIFHMKERCLKGKRRCLHVAGCWRTASYNLPDEVKKITFPLSDSRYCMTAVTHLKWSEKITWLPTQLCGKD